MAVRRGVFPLLFLTVALGAFMVAGNYVVHLELREYRVRGFSDPYKSFPVASELLEGAMLLVIAALITFLARRGAPWWAQSLCASVLGFAMPFIGGILALWFACDFRHECI